jgi:uncharacterized membrane protein
MEVLLLMVAGAILVGSICGIVAVVMASIIRNDMRFLKGRVNTAFDTIERIERFQARIMEGHAPSTAETPAMAQSVKEEAPPVSSKVTPEAEPIPLPEGPVPVEELPVAVPVSFRAFHDEPAATREAPAPEVPSAIPAESGSAKTADGSGMRYGFSDAVHVMKELLGHERSKEVLPLNVVAPGKEAVPLPAPPQKDYRAFWSDFEARVGKRWMTWLGGVLLIVSAGLFVKYAVDREWMGPAQRVILAILVGIVLVVLGGMALRKAMRALGLGLTGTGLAILYVALWGAYGYFHLVPRPLAFTGMVLVTMTGIGLAVFHDAMAIAILAVLGGFLTPIMLWTGQDDRDILFSYLILLDMGILGAAFFRRWRALDVLGFLGTMALYYTWHVKFYTSDALVPALIWLGAFYLVFLIVPFAHALRRAKPLTVERFLQVPVNALFTFGFAYHMMQADHRHALALIAVCMAACYSALAVAVRRRVRGDEAATFGCVALAVFFTTIAVPLRLGLDGVLLAWSAEAPLLVYLGYRFRYRPLRLGGFAVLLTTGIRLAMRDWPMHSEPFRLLLNVPFASAFCLPLAAFVFAAIHSIMRGKSDWGWDRALARIAGIAGGVLALTLLNVEFHQHFRLASELSKEQMKLMSLASGAIIWAAGAVLFALAGWRWKNRASEHVAFLSLVVGAFFVVLLHSVKIAHQFMPILNVRCLASLCVPLAAFLCGAVCRRIRRDEWEGEAGLMARIYGIMGGFLGLALLHIELHRYFIAHAAEWSGDIKIYAWGSAAALWAVGAALFTLAGSVLMSRASRRAAVPAVMVAGVLVFLLYGGDIVHAFRPVLNLRCLAALFVPAAAFLCALISARPSAGEVDVGNTLLSTGYWIGGGFALIILLHLELRAHFIGHVEQWGADRYMYGLAAGTAIWAAGAAAFALAGRRWKSIAALGAAAPALGVTVLLAIVMYGQAALGRFVPLLNARCLAALCGVAATLLYSWVIAERPAEMGFRRRGRTALFIGFLFLLAVLSAEALRAAPAWIENRERARWVGQMSLSVLWGLYAALFLGVGFARKMRGFRFAGLALFGIAAVKVALLDLSWLEQIYRIVSFVALGVLMIAASYAYHRLEKRLTMPDEPAGEGG